MIQRSSLMACLAGSLLILCSCDPGALVKSKVPTPLKDALGPGGPTRLKPGQAAATVAIKRPAVGAVYTAGQNVSFQADVNAVQIGEAKPPVINWTLTSTADKQTQKIGAGASVSKPLEAGAYEAEVTVDHLGQKISQKVSFRVALRMPGMIADSEGKGIAGIEVVATDLEGKAVMGQTTTDQRGSFLVEFPPVGGTVVVNPQKAGMSFWPVQKIVKYDKAGAPIEFKGVNAEITNMRLTGASEPAEKVTRLCPGEEALLSFDLKAPDKPSSFEVTLVYRDKEVEESIPLSQGSEPEGDSAQPTARKLKVLLPSSEGGPMTSIACHVMITVKDEKGAIYGEQSEDLVTVDPIACFDKGMDKGVAMLLAGKPLQAVEQFTRVERLSKNLEDSEHVAGSLSKLYFDRALANLMAALESGKDAAVDKALLERSLIDLNRTLRIQATDSEGLTMRAVVNYLTRKYDIAAKDATMALSARPDSVTALTLRALANIRTGVKRNLTQSVDDFTDILTRDPARSDLRKIRREVLKIVSMYQDRKSGERLNVSDAPVPEISATLDFKKHIRK